MASETPSVVSHTSPARILFVTSLLQVSAGVARGVGGKTSELLG